MNLESIIQTEVGEKEETKCRILTHICGIYKDGPEDPICRAAVDSGRGEEADSIGETQTTTQSQMANGNVLCDAGNSNLGSVTTWGCERVGGGRSFRREGTYIYLWLIHVDVWQNGNQYCKSNYPLIKNKFKKR